MIWPAKRCASDGINAVTRAATGACDVLVTPGYLPQERVVRRGSACQDFRHVWRHLLAIANEGAICCPAPVLHRIAPTDGVGNKLAFDGMLVGSLGRFFLGFNSTYSRSDPHGLA